MSSLQRRIAAITDTTANLIAQLRELDRLREQVRIAAAIRPEIAATETAEWERHYPAVSSEID